MTTENETRYTLANVKDLIPYTRNAKKHNKKQIDNVAKSISEFGMVQPIVVDRDNNVIIGHCRLLACKKLKIDQVPIVKLDDLTPEEANKLRLLDNKLNESEWDFDLLAEDIPEIDFTGYDVDWNLPDVKNDTEIEEDEAPDNVETRCKLGDIWQLGSHRLICGDSTDVAVIDRLMDGVKANMVFTDPPYGMLKEKDGVLNDNLDSGHTKLYDNLLDFNCKWIPLTFGALKDNGSWYCWGIDEPLMDIWSNILKPMVRENKITFRNLITWDKGNGQGQLSSGFMMYPVADEKCLFVQCGTQRQSINSAEYSEQYEPIRRYLYAERQKCGWDVPTMKTIAGHSDKSRDHWTGKSQWEFIPKKVYIRFQEWAKDHNVKAFEKEYEQLRKEYEQLRAYFDNTHDNMNSVWHFDRAGKDEREHTGGHATPKPIALCSRAIKSSSREDEIVLDVFGGSGSTLIACEQLNRKCYMAELDPRYVSVIIQRYINFKGSDADVFLLKDGKRIPYSEVV
jgi:DNA modification methylase